MIVWMKTFHKQWVLYCASTNLMYCNIGSLDLIDCFFLFFLIFGVDISFSVYFTTNVHVISVFGFVHKRSHWYYDINVNRPGESLSISPKNTQVRQRVRPDEILDPEDSPADPDPPNAAPT